MGETFMPLDVTSPREVHDLLCRYAQEVLKSGTADEEILGLGPGALFLEWPKGVPVPPQVTDRGAFDEDL
jgi:hypothetical protein